jgi:hypothetical protein
MSAAVLTATPVEDEHAEKLANIRKLMTLTGADKMANQMLDQISENMRSIGGPNSQKYFDEFRKEFDLNKVYEMQIAAYDKYLTAEDIKSVLDFYQSPVGQRMIASMPQIMADMMKQGMEMSQEIAQRVMKKMQEQQ